MTLKPTPLLVPLAVAKRLRKLGRKIKTEPTALVRSFLTDCLTAVEDNHRCYPKRAREHLVPLSVNVVRSLLKKPTTLLFAKARKG